MRCRGPLRFSSRHPLQSLRLQIGKAVAGRLVGWEARTHIREPKDVRKRRCNASTT